MMNKVFFLACVLCSCKHQRIRNWTNRFPISTFHLRFYAVLCTFSYWYCYFDDSLLWIFLGGSVKKVIERMEFNLFFFSQFVGGTRHWWSLCSHYFASRIRCENICLLYFFCFSHFCLFGNSEEHDTNENSHVANC